MKLVQLNAWGGRLDQLIADLLKQEAADIVCMQEVIDFDGRSLLFANLEELRLAGGYKESFHSPVFSFTVMDKLAHFGNAILTKRVSKKTETIFTNLEYKTNFIFDRDDYNIRNLQHTQLLIDGQTLHILNHHGHHVPLHKNGNADTLRQMQQISSYVDTLEGHILLAGDFNLSPESSSLGLINSRLRNLSTEFQLKTTRTGLTSKTEVCDYVFVSKGVQVQSFKVSDKLVSDHAALVLEFEL